MNYIERISQDDAMALIELLCEARKIREPRISFTCRTDRGFYNPVKRTIHIQRTPLVWVVVHEFIHHLDREDNGPKVWRKREAHDIVFFRKLKNITSVLGGDYPWTREYKQVARWAEVNNG